MVDKQSAKSGKSVPFWWLDVFTKKPFGGNPLVVIPNADSLSPALMLAIAREFNLSETVFLQKPKSKTATSRLRIFTPTQEIPFAGHPTIGALYWLATVGGHNTESLILESGVGLLPGMVRQKGKQLLTGFSAPKATPVPLALDSSQAASILGLKVTDLYRGGKHPILAATSGLPYALIPLKNQAALSKISFDQAKWQTLMGQEEASQLYAFVPADSGGVVHSRMFAPTLGISEDPATGSALPPLLWWHQLNSHQIPKKGLLVQQGLELGRPSLLNASLTSEGIPQIWGQSHLLGEGKLFL